MSKFIFKICLIIIFILYVISTLKYVFLGFYYKIIKKSRKWYIIKTNKFIQKLRKQIKENILFLNLRNIYNSRVHGW